MKLFFVFCILEFIIQNSLLSAFKREKDIEYWNMYVGVLIGWFISTFLVYSSFSNDERLDLGGAIIVLFIMAFSIVLNLILLIRGTIVKKKIDGVTNPSNNKACLLALIVVLVFNTIFFVVIPNGMIGITKLDTEKRALDYLNKKYGNNSFSVVSVENDFSYDGIVVKHHIGYEVSVSTPRLDRNVTVTIRGTNPIFFEGMSDDFLEEYYEDDINSWIKEKYGLECYVSRITSPKPLDNLGHIPSIDELIEAKADIDLSIISKMTSKFDFDEDIEGRKTFIKELTKDLKDHYNITKDFEYIFSRWNLEKSFRYDVSVKGNKMIINKNNENYELNLDE